ncbi:MAG: tRNA 2-selenouridine(34) synthase MnmH [Peptococcaceae bacterium]|nr:tRNA 2-selenouridine(34) synthase MnmH [Peptococcaceae bacterium]
MYKEITVKEALAMDETLLIDVRSEGEYAEDTIPGAVNIPVLNDEERAAVGTLYHRDGPDPARRLALKLVSPRLSEKVAAVDRLAGGGRKVAVFCWRGGQRSQFMASVLATMGYDVYRVIGGYKAYRRFVNEYLDRAELTQKAVVLHGLTGVGKTEVLNRLGQKGLPVLDLEGLARHRGSVYGKIGMPPSPTQKAFESGIVHFLSSIGEKGVFLVECESRRVGSLLVPLPLMNSMKKGYRVLLYTSLENRVRRIREVYTAGPQENVKQLQEATASLAGRLGRARVEELNRLLAERNFEPVFAYLLKNYYDPLYKYPDGPSEAYHLSVDATDIEKASDDICAFVKKLPEYRWADGP